MSVKVMADVWASTRAKPLARLVLLAIADHANEEDRTAWPSIGLLSRKTGLSESTVRRYVESLRRGGEIQVIPTVGAPNRYVVREYGGVSDIDTPFRLTPLSGVKATPVTAMEGGGCHSYDTRTIIEPSKNHQRARRRLPSRPWPDDFTLTAERKAWAESGGLTDVEGLWGRFKDHHLAVGSCFANWHSAWQKWCRKEVLILKERSERSGRRFA